MLHFLTKTTPQKGCNNNERTTSILPASLMVLALIFPRFRENSRNGGSVAEYTVSSGILRNCALNSVYAHDEEPLHAPQRKCVGQISEPGTVGNTGCVHVRARARHLVAFRTTAPPSRGASAFSARRNARTWGATAQNSELVSIARMVAYSSAVDAPKLSTISTNQQ